VSKRRLQTPEEAEPENLTPEQKREQRRRERAKKKAGHGSTTTSPWRKAAVIGIPVVVIAAVAIFLIVSNLPTPCLQFGPIANSTPTAPNEPTFPATSGSGFSGSWCLTSTPVYDTSFYLTIDISGTTVSLPALIGQRSNYTAGTCILPIHTQTGAASQVVSIDSPWAYEYNLSMFFNVWSQTDSSAYVSSSNTSQPIVYQTQDILGYSSNSSDHVSLWVDQQPSSAGPNLDVTTLDNGPTTPSCLAKINGDSHKILIYYGSSNPLSLRPLLESPSLQTGLADPSAVVELANGTAPHFGLLAPLENALSQVQMHSLLWLTLRVGP